MRPRRKIATNSQRRRAVFALIAVFLLSAASCVPATDEATLGEIGALSFSFPLTGERSLGLEHPIAMNQLAEIRIRSRGGARLPSPLAVAVDDPSIASCQARYRLSDEIRIACRGVREGIAELRVVAADGAIVDWVFLRVAPTVRIGVSVYRETSADRVDLVPGQNVVLGTSEQLSLVVTPFDPTDVELVAVNAVNIAPSSAEVVTVERDIWSAGNRFWVRGLKPGQQTVELSIDGRSFVFDLRVL